MTLRRILVCTAALAACASLAACSTPGPLPAPAAISTDIMRAEISVEVAVRSAVIAKNEAEKSGQLTGVRAAQADATERQVFAALKVVRAAADAGLEPDLTTVTNLIVQLAAYAPPAK